jgi:outer membrane cobalamin receptor
LQFSQPQLHRQFGRRKPSHLTLTDSESSLDTIVVTGTAIAGGVKKLEASYNIVTATEEEIRRANPKSTADLLKISPGMWPESTGGQTGANIEIAGISGRR